MGLVRSTRLQKLAHFDVLNCLREILYQQFPVPWPQKKVSEVTLERRKSPSQLQEAVPKEVQGMDVSRSDLSLS